MQQLMNYEACQRAMQENADCLIAFTASWCPACTALFPHLQNVAKRRCVLIADVDRVPDFANEEGITTVPTVLVKRGQKVVNVLRGCTKAQLYAIP